MTMMMTLHVAIHSGASATAVKIFGANIDPDGIVVSTNRELSYSVLRKPHLWMDWDNSIDTLDIYFTS